MKDDNSIELNKAAPGLFPVLINNKELLVAKKAHCHSHYHIHDRKYYKNNIIYDHSSVSLDSNPLNEYEKNLKKRHDKSYNFSRNYSEDNNDYCNDETYSFDSSVGSDIDSINRLYFLQVLKKLPENYKQELINDKFYLTKLYNSVQFSREHIDKTPSCGTGTKNTNVENPIVNEIQYDNFLEYEKAILREDKLRTKFYEYKDGLSNSLGEKLEVLDDLTYFYVNAQGYTPSVRINKYLKNVNSKTSGKYYHKSFSKYIRRKTMGKLQKTKYAKKFFNHLFYKNTANKSNIKNCTILRTLDSQPITEIIDENGPEYGYIETRLEPNFFKNNNGNFYINIIEQQQETDLIDCELVDEDAYYNSNNDRTHHYLRKRKSGQKYALQRKLGIRHLQMLSLGATIGIGVFLNSGMNFSIAGPLGAFLGFLFSAFIVIATLLCFAEIVALIPLIVAISGLVSRFIGDAAGFAVGWVYWLSYVISFPAELLATTILLSYYPKFDELTYLKGHFAGFLIMFVLFLTIINLMDVRVYGEIEYFASTFKLIVITFMIILMIVINCGGIGSGVNDRSYIGFRFWDRSKSPEEHITYGPFRPTFDLKDTGKGALTGIGGFGGVLLELIASTNNSLYSYIGSEIGFVAAGEATNPRKAVPSVTKRIYTRVIVFYLLSIFAVGLNIYSGDPRLLRYSANARQYVDGQYAEFSDILNKLGGSYCQNPYNDGSLNLKESPNQSPWVIALKSFNLCSFASSVNAFFVIIGLFAASSQLYVSSRTLYSMAIQQKAPQIFSTCNKYGVPYMSVLFCGSFGFLSLLTLDGTATTVLYSLVQIGTQGSVIMWFAMNLAFYRFYCALKGRVDIVSRDSKEYPYKSPLQPYLSIFGMISTCFLLVTTGFQNFMDWNTNNFISSYLTVLLFFVLYIGYSLIKRSGINKLEELDLDSGRKEMDRIIWEEDKDYSPNLKELLHKVFSYI
ncbi:uncharacterized protein SCODWIG_02593 [Saccharomycodes ludwigii]|uniref:Amino acid permease/ SLC12A domain-containing protein n=1 Tax=Saccharomycodes ludwigii TaxID=36035 RepID=A0A376B844_9ASCO|nr:hypothetical protein SCDLUD_001980 [Saccharomycodes ludwigii]KAH3902166.1 hypothetical protein SCDLUD_001980 [Saccharomycodes ludwigii]SSD60832.1 uncharacterized protein SCODWIG_02593 [Saccharomycodes ludwigii]